VGKIMAGKVLAVTSCAVGVAHTYMAAENLEKAAESMGVDIKVETHGSIGVENKLTEKDVEEATGLIITADTEIDKSRFEGLQTISVGVQRGIREPEQLIQQILDNEGKVIQSSDGESEEEQKRGGSQNPIYRSLMNGVSYMVPFVVTGGLLIAIALSLGGQSTGEGIVIESGTIWEGINAIGEAAMNFMIPILAGYMAYSIADRPGLVPGMVGGYIAATDPVYGGDAQTGFLGGIIAGFLAGYIALAIKKIPVPKAVESVMPIIFIPILSSLAVGLIFIYVIGIPIAGLFNGLTNWLTSLEGTSTVVLATIIGSMIAFDMGGPFNKVAFLFGVGLIAEGQYSVMGMIAVAVCVPPLALGIASLTLKNKFDREDREAGKAAVAMGLFGITEGAIPFAAKDPIRVIPSIMIGSSVGSIIAALANVGNTVAHGGPIVALLGAVDGIFMFTVATIVGVAVTISLMYFLKGNVSSSEAAVATDQGEPRVNEEESDFFAETDRNEEPTSYSLTDLITPELIKMEIKATDKKQAIDELLSMKELQSVLTDKDQLYQDVLDRENEGTTGMGESIAIPHAKSDAIDEPTVLFGRSDIGVEWESLDGTPAKVIFMILVPSEHKGDTHLKILQLLARKLTNEEFKESLLEAETKEDVYEIIKTV